MSLTADELAALGRFMGGEVVHAVVHELDGYWFNESNGCASWLPPEYLAADVLTLLVEAGAEPSMWTRNPTHICVRVTTERREVDGEPCAIREPHIAPSWRMAVLKAAAAYQLAKEHP